MKRFFIVFSVFLLSCNPAIYIVRHAEKAAPAMGGPTDVPLTPAGENRALALREMLKGKKIGYIFSTNTVRTRSTAKPTADFFGLPIEIYGPLPDSAFIALLKSKTKNTLVVGHSNTIDDIANMLCGERVVAGDLEDKEYDNLFVVKKKGKRYILRKEKYGAPSH